MIICHNELEEAMQSFCQTNKSPHVTEENNRNAESQLLRADINKHLQTGRISDALLAIAEYRDFQQNIYWDKSNPNLIIRDARSVRENTLPNNRLGYAMLGLNTLRACQKLVELPNSNNNQNIINILNLGKEEKRKQLFNQLAFQFWETITNPMNNNNHADDLALLNQTLISILACEFNISTKEAKKRLSTAKDFVNLEDPTRAVATVFEVNALDKFDPSYFNSDSNEHHSIFFEANLPLTDWLDEQKEHFDNRANKNWFQTLPKWHQELVNNYSASLTDGQHVIPHQLQGCPIGVRNAYQTICGRINQNQSLRIFHESFHAKKVTQQDISNNEEERQAIAKLNTRQLAWLVGDNQKIHFVTLNKEKNYLFGQNIFQAPEDLEIIQTNLTINGQQQPGPENHVGSKQELNDVCDIITELNEQILFAAAKDYALTRSFCLIEHAFTHLINENLTIIKNYLKSRKQHDSYIFQEALKNAWLLEDVKAYLNSEETSFPDKLFDQFIYSWDILLTPRHKRLLLAAILYRAEIQQNENHGTSAASLLNMINYHKRKIYPEKNYPKIVYLSENLDFTNIVQCDNAFMSFHDEIYSPSQSLSFNQKPILKIDRMQGRQIFASDEEYLLNLMQTAQNLKSNINDISPSVLSDKSDTDESVDQNSDFTTDESIDKSSEFNFDKSSTKEFEKKMLREIALPQARASHTGFMAGFNGGVLGAFGFKDKNILPNNYPVDEIKHCLIRPTADFNNKIHTENKSKYFFAKDTKNLKTLEEWILFAIQALQHHRKQLEKPNTYQKLRRIFVRKAQINNRVEIINSTIASVIEAKSTDDLHTAMDTAKKADQVESAKHFFWNNYNNENLLQTVQNQLPNPKVSISRSNVIDEDDSPPFNPTHYIFPFYNI